MMLMIGLYIVLAMIVAILRASDHELGLEINWTHSLVCFVCEDVMATSADSEVNVEHDANGDLEDIVHINRKSMMINVNAICVFLYACVI